MKFGEDGGGSRGYLYLVWDEFGIFSIFLVVWYLRRGCVFYIFGFFCFWLVLELLIDWFGFCRGFIIIYFYLFSGFLLNEGGEREDCEFLMVFLGIISFWGLVWGDRNV